jgi:hypothetical protein
MLQKALITMKTWVYYLDKSSSGVDMLYRVREDMSDPKRRFREDAQVYNRRHGWITDDEFVMEMNRTGFVSREDIISEAEAEEFVSKIAQNAAQQSATEAKS